MAFLLTARRDGQLDRERAQLLRRPIGALDGFVVLPGDLGQLDAEFVVDGLTITRSSNTVSDVIMGCAMPEGEQGMNVARLITLAAGFPTSVPAITVNRFCCSGSQTIALAADSIRSGNTDIAIAGGVESMSMVAMSSATRSSSCCSSPISLSIPSSRLNSSWSSCSIFILPSPRTLGSRTRPRHCVSGA